MKTRFVSSALLLAAALGVSACTVVAPRGSAYYEPPGAVWVQPPPRVIVVPGPRHHYHRYDRGPDRRHRY